MGATLLKDGNYREEREVRIVAIPGTEELKARALKEYPNEFKPVPLRSCALARTASVT